MRIKGVAISCLRNCDKKPICRKDNDIAKINPRFLAGILGNKKYKIQTRYSNVDKITENNKTNRALGLGKKLRSILIYAPYPISSPIQVPNMPNPSF
ncbi:TPA: hypothetical protein NDT82_005655 [Klebsiella pneumoniae]|nr:hypothetical protein [Klebsiella pneumoniae]